MRPTPSRWFAPLLLAVAVVATAAAADQLPIPADHRWLIKADVATLLHGQLGQTMRDLLAQQPHAARLAVFAQLTGIDLLKDVDRVALTGVDGREDQVVFIAQGRFDGTKLANLVSANATHSSELHGDVTLHRWIDDKSGKPQFGAVLGNAVVVAGRSRERVLKVIDVASGAAPSLGTPAWLGASDGALIVLAAADGLDAWQGLKPDAEAFKRLKSLRIAIAERGDQLACDAIGTPVDAAAAHQLGDLTRGLIALAQLGDPKNQPPVLRIVLSSLNVQEDADHLQLSFTLPLDKVREVLTQAAAGAAK